MPSPEVLGAIAGAAWPAPSGRTRWLAPQDDGSRSVSLRRPSAQLPAHPFELAADIVDDIAGLQIFRQDVPGVGLDFELTRQRFFLVKAQRLLDRKARRTERAKIVEEYRHVKVRAPFPRSGILLPSNKRIFKIEKAGELAVLFLNGLRQINCVGVALECFDDRLRHLRHVQGGGFLQLEDRYTGVDQLLEILGNVLVFDGLMANIEYDAQMPAQRAMGLRDRNMSKPR